MAGRSPKEASEKFAFYLRETLNCVTEQELLLFQKSAHIHIVTFKDPAPLTSSDGSRYWLSVSQAFTIMAKEDGMYKAHSREYSYVFSESEEMSHHGVVSYHWHPYISNLSDPHMHLHVDGHADSPRHELLITKAHYPTSRVCLEDFISLLVKYYGIRPAHTKWRSVLKKNKAAFALGATWTVSHPK